MSSPVTSTILRIARPSSLFNQLRQRLTDRRIHCSPALCARKRPSVAPKPSPGKTDRLSADAFLDSVLRPVPELPADPWSDPVTFSPSRSDPSYRRHDQLSSTSSVTAPSATPSITSPEQYERVRAEYLLLRKQLGQEEDLDVDEIGFEGRGLEEEMLASHPMFDGPEGAKLRELFRTEGRQLAGAGQHDDDGGGLDAATLLRERPDLFREDGLSEEDIRALMEGLEKDESVPEESPEGDEMDHAVRQAREAVMEQRFLPLRDRIALIQGDPVHAEGLGKLLVTPPAGIELAERHRDALGRFNRFLQYSYMGPNEDVRRVLWAEYRRVKALFGPSLLSRLSDDVWDMLWWTQAMRWRSNPKRKEHLDELQRDLESVGRDGPPTKSLE